MWRKTFQQQIWPVRDKLFRFACSLLGNQAEAEDVVQETFLRALSQGEHKGVENPEAWCMTVARNLSYDQLRRRQKSSIPIGDKQGEWERLEESSTTPEQQLVALDGISHIQKLIGQLPATQREVMHLRDIEGHSYQEIADILQVEVGLVKASLSRARKKVKEQIIALEAYGNQKD